MNAAFKEVPMIKYLASGSISCKYIWAYLLFASVCCVNYIFLTEKLFLWPKHE